MNVVLIVASVLFLLGIVLYAVYEWWAIATNHITISAIVWMWTKDSLHRSLLMLGGATAIGFVIGLFVHFLWP